MPVITIAENEVLGEQPEATQGVHGWVSYARPVFIGTTAARVKPTCDGVDCGSYRFLGVIPPLIEFICPPSRPWGPCY